MSHIHRFIKQPSENYPKTWDFSPQGATPKLPTGTTIISGTVSAARLDLASTTLSVIAAVGATTISLPVNVVAGAILILNPGAATEEERIVTGVTGTGPYTTTLDRGLTNGHAANEAIDYYPGASVEVLSSTTVAITDGVKATYRPQAGVNKKLYKITLRATLSDNSILEDEMLMDVVDI